MGQQDLFIVVNRKSAKVFEISRKPDGITWIKTLRNPLGTTKNKLMTTDKPGMGRSKFSKIRAPHTLTGKSTPHEETAKTFAKKISHFVKARKLEQTNLIFTIAAEPHMMGLVKKAMDQDKFKAPVKWVQKDLEKLTTDKLERLLFKGKKTRPLS
jgi:protein required for attachment to host cells